MNTSAIMQNSRNFKILLLCDFLSSFGSCFLATALTIFKYREYYNLLTVSIFPLILVLSNVASFFITKKFTLHISFRWLFFFGEILTCLFAVALFFASKTFWAIVIVYAIFSTFFATLETYRAEFLKAITTNEQMPFRQSISRTVNLLVVVVGSLLAGIVGDRLPLEKQNLMYLITASVYPFTALIILFISKNIYPMQQNSPAVQKQNASSPATTTPQNETQQKSRKIFRFTKASPIFVGSLIISFVGAAASLLTLVYIFNVLKSSAFMYSLLMVASAIGAALGSLVVALPFVQKNLKLLSTIGIAIVGLLLFSVIFTPPFLVMLPILALSGFISSLAMTYYSIELFTYYQQNVIRSKFALFQILLNVASCTANPLAGLSEQYFGIVNSFLICGGGFLIVAPINYIPAKAE